MGSLRGYETLLGSDVRLIKAEANGKEIEILQLKQHKTSRSNPFQVGELSEIAGLLCPVKAFRVWRRGRKAPILGVGGRFSPGRRGNWSKWGR